MSMSEVKKQHGGARPGAGRKTKYASTVVTRVPEKYLDVIKALIHHLDECEMVDRNYNDMVSEPIFLRSLKDKPQAVIFKVSAIKKT
ncbi:hypothetical protein [Shewanella sairae]|nr:hypothetical protein [Shewanella sairae]